MPPFSSSHVSWYEMGGFVSGSCFLSPSSAISSSSSSVPLLLTTTLRDGAYIWRLSNNNKNEQSTTVVTRVASPTSSSSSSSSSVSFTSCCVAGDEPGAFVCGAADGSIWFGSAATESRDNNNSATTTMQKIVSTTSTSSPAAEEDAAVIHVSPLSRKRMVMMGANTAAEDHSSAGAASSCNNYLSLCLNGRAAIVDLRAPTPAFRSQIHHHNNNYSSSGLFHCASSVDERHIALAADGGHLLLFDIRKLSNKFAPEQASRIFSLKNQVTALCRLPGGGLVAATVGGRVLTVRATHPVSSCSDQQQQQQEPIIREEAVALPSNDRYPFTHVDAVDILDRDHKHQIVISCAAADGSLSYFSKKNQPLAPSSSHQQQQQENNSASWKSTMWRLRDQKPAALSLATTADGRPVMSASYVSGTSNTQSKVGVVSLI